jgi:hypothetical protein
MLSSMLFSLEQGQLVNTLPLTVVCSEHTAEISTDPVKCFSIFPMLLVLFNDTYFHQCASFAGTGAQTCATLQPHVQPLLSWHKGRAHQWDIMIQ